LLLPNACKQSNKDFFSIHARFDLIFQVKKDPLQSQLLGLALEDFFNGKKYL